MKLILLEYSVGKFSNSATTDSQLYAEILVDKDDVCIFLYEYGNRLVKTYSYTEYYITMKTDDGKKEDLEGIMYSDRIYVADDNGFGRLVPSDAKKIIQALQTSKTVSFHIVDADYRDTYLFTVNSSNFTALYNQMNYNQWG